MDLSDRRTRTSPVLGIARTVTDWCRLLRTRPAALAGRLGSWWLRWMIEAAAD
jgi:hypothetical protein